MKQFLTLNGWQKATSVATVVAVSLVVFGFVANASSTIGLNVQTDGTLFVATSTSAQTLAVQGDAIFSGSLISISSITATGTVATANLKVGGGDTLAKIQKGTCNMITAGTVTATSTAYFDCAVSGVASGDLVFAQVSTTTAPTSGIFGFSIIGTSASTTAGFITFKIANATGATAAVPTTFSNGVQYVIVR